jgi:hypothetical protein
MIGGDRLFTRPRPEPRNPHQLDGRERTAHHPDRTFNPSRRCRGYWI